MRKSSVVFALNPQTDAIAKRVQKDSFVSPHKFEGGKRKGKTMKKNPRARKSPYVTVGQAKAALAIDPNAVWDAERKMIIYNRKAGQ